MTVTVDRIVAGVPLHHADRAATPTRFDRTGGFGPASAVNDDQRATSVDADHATFASTGQARPSGPGWLPGVRLAEHGRQRLLRFVAADDDIECIRQTQNAREVAVPRIGVEEP